MPRARGTASAVTLTTTTETVLATLPGIAPAIGQPIDLIASIDLTTGTAVTGVTFNIRRGTGITGTIVATIGPIAIAASTRGEFVLVGVDLTLPESANAQYVITGTQAAATGNGTANNVTIRADWG
jgi:hypothetical protein